MLRRPRKLLKKSLSLYAFLHCTNKLSFPLWISPVNVTKSAVPDLVTFTGGILNEKLKIFAALLYQ